MRIALAGGGTGGHFFPALEMAKILRKKGIEVFFVGVKTGIEAKRAPEEGLEIFFVPFEGVRKRGIRTLVALAKLPLSLIKCTEIFRKKTPDLVICTGGYSSFPAGFTAFIFGIPLFLHEQNTIPGWANIVLSIFAKKVFISFEESKKNFPTPEKLVLLGNPVRKDILEAPRSSKKTGFTILVFGGSRGAKRINDAVLQALPTLEKLGIKLIHQTGELDFEQVKKAYQNSKTKAKVLKFIENMGEAYREANLVISRSGAGTLFELSALGKPAVLVPYPHAVGDHQKKNAEVLAKRKAAVLIDNQNLTGENLSKLITKFYFNRRILYRMEKRAKGALKLFSESEFLKSLEVGCDKQC